MFEAVAGACYGQLWRGVTTGGFHHRHHFNG